MSGTTGNEDRRGFKRLMADGNSRKAFIAVGAVSALVLGYVLFFSGPAAGPPSRAISLPDRQGEQATVAVSPVYGEQLARSDRDASAQATRTGGSALPTPTVQSQTNQLPTTIDGSDDVRPRSIREPEPERPAPPAPPPPSLPPLPTAAPAPVQPQIQQGQPVQQPMRPMVDPTMVEAMKRQMDEIRGRGAPTAVTTVFAQQRDGGQQAGLSGAGRPGTPSAGLGAIGSSVYGQAGSPQGSGITGGGIAGSGITGGGTSNAAYGGTVRSRFAVPAAGTMLYSRLVGRVDSDAPGPVIGEILQGPYTGARLLGSFQFGERGVIISFTSMTVPYTENGEERSELVPINAVAVDSKHLGTAMATDIDRHILERVGVAFGSAFLEGLGTAIARSGSTAVVNPLGGTTVTTPTLNGREQLFVAGGAAAGAVGRIGESIFGNRRTTITVDAGTPFGLLFLGNRSGGAGTN